jgi:hypothetical protein
MKMVLIRVGVDSGCGGIQGPLFEGKTFEYIPIPDDHGIDSRTYGNTKGRHGGRLLVEYFQGSRLQSKMKDQAIHFDPEFETYTYGDPSRLKSSLRNLVEGDMLVFYCGLEGWKDFKCDPALYLMGYFEVLKAGIATNLESSQFSKNFHVMHQEQKDRLVLVKGSNKSRLLKKAVLISTMGRDSANRPLKIQSPDMKKRFGDFGGLSSLQRSTPRWVAPSFVDRAAEYMRSLD